MMNIHRIIAGTRSEGPGNRVAIWMQGCSIHCEGCMAENTWSTNPKQIMDVKEILNIINRCHGIEGVTILGGEPFDQVKELAKLTCEIKKTKNSLLVFTGYTYEELISRNDSDIVTILNNTDVLIDGAYIESKRSFDRSMVGSDNQRYIFLSDRYKMSDFKKNTVEIRISKEGIISYNGMCDFRNLKER